jgi:hypothetical protein
MDKGALGIAGLVAGIVGVLVGVFAYMNANSAADKADQALVLIDEGPSDAVGPAEIRRAVKEEIAATKAELEAMVAAARADITELQEQAERADVLLDAKRHADANAARSSENLKTEVKALQQEMTSGDQETKAHYDKLKAEIAEEIKKRDEAIKRMVTRWMESGAM